jgi:hypothetical protein
MRIVKAKGILRHHVEFPAEDGKGFAINRMSVTGSMDLGPGFVNLAVDSESSGVYGFIAYHYLAIFVDKDQIRNADLAEVLRKRIEPCEQRRISPDDGHREGSSGVCRHQQNSIPLRSTGCDGRKSK